MRHLPVLLAVTLLGGCGWLRGDDSRARHVDDDDLAARMAARKPGIVEAEPGLGGAHGEVAPGPRFVALVVVDTLRADRTALCGHDRPNTPFLQTLWSRASARTCAGVTPAAWTLPTHATYFTGRPTAEHGVHTLGTPLSADAETLAETYAARGYQTVMVSANPVFSKQETGFWQGFDTVVAAKGLYGDLREELAPRLDRVLSRLDPERPVFLFLNVFDAHDPFAPIPEGLDWVEPAGWLHFHPNSRRPSNPYFRFVTGKLDEAEHARYADRVTDAYDHAILVADRNLEAVWEVFEGRGLLGDHRVVVTSDHGEHLGEHGLLRHGSATWETVTRVPWLWLESGTGAGEVALPDPVSTSITHGVLREGALPAELPALESATTINPDDYKPSWVTVSVWGEDSRTKLMAFDGELRAYDLRADPTETAPGPVAPTHPLLPLLTERLAAHERSLQDAEDRAADPDVMQLLEELGYAQPGE